MAQYTCGVCGYTYDEAAGVLFSELSDSWLCPVCSAGKQQFTLTSSPAKETGYTGTSVARCPAFPAAAGR